MTMKANKYFSIWRGQSRSHHDSTPHASATRTIPIIAIIATLFIVPLAFAQAVGYSNSVTTTSGQVPAGALAPVLAIPGSTIAVCEDSACVSRATTYTSASAGTPCATNAQLVPATGTGTCTSLVDNQGNFFFWILPGSYYYRITLPAGAGGGSYTYPISVGASAGCPLGATCDASYNTLALACAAAGTGTLYVTKSWNGLATASYGCNIQFLANGIIKPASGQTVTLTGSISGSLTRHFDYSLGTVAFTAKSIPFPVQWFGALCNNSTDDGAAQQAALSAGVPVSYVYAANACLTSVALTTGADGQQIVGSGSGSSATQGVSIIRASASISGPVLAIVNYGVVISNLTIDANGNANNGIVAGCAYQGLLSKVHITGALLDNLLISNTTSPYTTCESSTPSNDFLKVADSRIDNSAGGYGIHITVTSSDINNNNIHFDNDVVTGNFKSGILAGGSSGQINGGNWSNNGANSGATQYYCIETGLTGASQATDGWQINYPDVETCNYNTGSSAYRGAQVLLGPTTHDTVFTSNGNISSFGSAAGKYLNITGSACWHAINDAGAEDICGTGDTSVSLYQVYDHYHSTSTPIYQLFGSDGGYTGQYPALANSNTGSVQTDSTGKLSQVTNTRITYSAPLADAADAVPQGQILIPVDATSHTVALNLNSVPLAGECHIFVLKATSGGRTGTLTAFGSSPANVINLAGGPTSGPVTILSAVGDMVRACFEPTSGWYIGKFTAF